jgi:hypothetical protein
MSVNAQISISPKTEDKDNDARTIRELQLELKILREEVMLLRRLLALKPKMKGRR